MAGDNQHFIPRLVLKGFRAQGKGKIPKVWKYPRVGAICCPAVTGVASERHFYSGRSGDGSETLDDVITRYEHERLDGLVTRLRSFEIGAEVDAGLAAEAVAHLIIRNAHFREAMQLAASSIAGVAKELFGDVETVRRMMGLDVLALNPKFEALIEDTLAGNPRLQTLPLPKPVLKQVAFALTREAFPRIFAEQQVATSLLLSMLDQEGGALAHASQVKTLASSVVPPEQIARLEQLSWRIAPSVEGAILPDCVGIGVKAGGAAQALLLCGTEFDLAIMPLGPDRLLLGLRCGAPAPDLAEFNKWAARCSQDFFVASENTDELGRLTSLIGEATAASLAASISKDALGFDVDPTIVPNDDNRVPVVPSSRHVPPEPKTELPPFQVSFLDCAADQAEAEAIGQMVSDIAAYAAQTVPMGRLDGVTFANDYELALENLDRGFQASTPLKTSSEYVGIGMAPVVIREGVAKIHIVLRGYIAHDLVSDDLQTRSHATYILLHELGQVGCLAWIEDALPGATLGTIADGLDGLTYEAIDHVWGDYFCARVSAALWPEGISEARQMLIETLEKAQVQIPAARLDYRFHGDIPTLLGVSIERVRWILRAAALLAGHADARGARLYDDEGRGEAALREYQLGDWLESFAADLRCLWDRRGKYESFNEFLSLTHHVIRLHYGFGIFLWRNEVGGTRVEVPLHTDADKLGIESIRRALAPLREAFASVAKLFTRAPSGLVGRAEASDSDVA